MVFMYTYIHTVSCSDCGGMALSLVVLSFVGIHKKILLPVFEIHNLILSAIIALVCNRRIPTSAREPYVLLGVFRV